MLFQVPTSEAAQEAAQETEKIAKKVEETKQKIQKAVEEKLDVPEAPAAETPAATPSGTCEDTPGWTNGYDKKLVDCHVYGKMSRRAPCRKVQCFRRSPTERPMHPDGSM